jgi:transcriptional regulator with XRE-family HTH domain
MALYLASDAEIYSRICQGCREKRLALGLTQDALARRAGVALRTVKNFEQGASINVMSLMKLMRALGEAQRFESLVPEVVPSPRQQFLGTATVTRPRRRHEKR